MGSVSRFSSSSVSCRVSGAGVAPASLVASRRWAWRSAFVSGGRFRFASASAACRAARRLSVRSGGRFVSLAVVLACGCVGSASSVGFSSSSLCSPCASFGADFDELWRVGGLRLACPFFGGGLVGRCSCRRSRCRFCFPLVPVSPALGAVLVAVARSAGLPSVPSSLRRVLPGRPVSAVQVARVRRLLGL